jgi:Peptidase family S41
MRSVFNRLCFIILLSLLSIQAEASENPWVALTQADLQAIHDLLQENHPGPVDPQNQRYAQWLRDGLEQANRQAASAVSFSDYVRCLQYYTNGFQDGHIGIGLEVQPSEVTSPGFIVHQASGAAEVIYAEPDAGVPKGAKVLSCDGKTLDELIAERIQRYYWNSAIPHERVLHLDRLFYQDALDSRSKFKRCEFSTGEVDLKWRKVERETFMKRLDEIQGGNERDPYVKRLNGVWLVRLPTFAYSGEERVKKIRELIQEIKTHATVLRQSTVVFDVRGNHGGDSAWGEEVAAALWGKEWVKWITISFDNTVDWRASKSNYEFIQLMLDREKKAGLEDQVTYLTKVSDAMKKALDSGSPLARVEDSPTQSGPAPAQTVSGKIYFFTDNECASACLDFADLMTRLPKVRHVGLPTSADAIYIDNTYSVLPSGLAGLGYSMKVFRNRARGNNEWYEPKVRWPGGTMTDESVTRWITSLDSRH